jgi:hypothetical protein
MLRRLLLLPLLLLLLCCCFPHASHVQAGKIALVVYSRRFQ